MGRVDDSRFISHKLFNTRGMKITFLVYGMKCVIDTVEEETTQRCAVLESLYKYDGQLGFLHVCEKFA